MRSGYKAQVTPGFTMFSDDQLEQLHLATLEVLRRTGVEVLAEEAQELFKKAGADQPPESFVEAVDGGVQLLGMSALLTTTMLSMKLTIDALAEAGVRDKVKVMVGGAPVTEAWAREIGADGYAPDAASAVRAAKEMLGTYLVPLQLR